MKKLTILFLVLLLAGGLVIAQDNYLSAKSFELLPGLDMFAETGVPLFINPDLLQGMDFNLRVDYNLDIIESSRLTFILENMTFIPVLRNDLSISGLSMQEQRTANNNAIDTETWLYPGVKFTQTMGFGNLYAQVEAPINILKEINNTQDSHHINFMVGWDSTFGLEVNAKLFNRIKRNTIDPEFLESLGVSGTYGFGMIDAGVEVGVPLIRDGIRNMGLTVVPELGYTLMPNFRLFGSAEFMNILAENEVNFNMSLGARFNF